MPGETPQQRKERLAERNRVDSHLSKSSKVVKVVRPKRPATAKQMAARKLVIAADNKRVAKLNAAGKNAATRKKITPPAVSQGVSAITNALTGTKNKYKGK